MFQLPKKIKLLSVLIFLIVAVVACQKLLPSARPDDQLLDGPVEGLTPEQATIFLRG